MLKRCIVWLLLLCLVLCACGQSAPAGTETDMTAREIIEVMFSAGPVPADMEFVFYDAEAAVSYLETGYGIRADDIADASMVMPSGMSAFSLVVIHLTEDADTDAAIQHLQLHQLTREGDFTGYAPDQAALAANGLVLSAGQWLASIISEDTDAVQAAFQSCFTAGANASVAERDASWDGLSRLPLIQPGIDDMTIYDTSSILAAWESGDRTALSQKDAAILSAAEDILAECCDATMSDYEKELAIYAWLTFNVAYDWRHQQDPAAMDPASSDPYGALVNQTAICLGVATGFQLLMDLSGIECITVVGAAFNSLEDHAWNMVRLDGQWYCVDATWELGSTPEYFRYFNVTSDYMADTNHQWDYDSIPEATATDGGKP